VGLDTWLFPFDRPSLAPTVPVLWHVCHAWFDWAENFDATLGLFKKCHADSRCIVLKKSAHLNYCDFAWHAPAVLRRLQRTGGIDENVGFQIIATQTVAFLQQHLGLSVTVSPIPEQMEREHTHIVSN
jgi:hypothetical protein